MDEEAGPDATGAAAAQGRGKRADAEYGGVLGSLNHVRTCVAQELGQSRTIGPVQLCIRPPFAA